MARNAPTLLPAPSRLPCGDLGMWAKLTFFLEPLGEEWEPGPGCPMVIGMGDSTASLQSASLHNFLAPRLPTQGELLSPLCLSFFPCITGVLVTSSS